MTAGTLTRCFCCSFDPAPPLFSKQMVSQVTEACCAGDAFT
jgi:hypothetical protein